LRRDHVCDVSVRQVTIRDKADEAENETSYSEADGKSDFVLFEPAATRNTGNVSDDRFTAPDGAKI
jgi:hypothetical protein